MAVIPNPEQTGYTGYAPYPGAELNSLQRTSSIYYSSASACAIWSPHTMSELYIYCFTERSSSCMGRRHRLHCAVAGLLCAVVWLGAGAAKLAPYTKCWGASRPRVLWRGLCEALPCASASAADGLRTQHATSTGACSPT